MEKGRRRFFRVALFAKASLGFCSLPVRVAETLESLGHTVLMFVPSRWPSLFTPEGIVDDEALSAFLSTQRLDLLLVADGLGFRGARAAHEAGTACGLLCAQPDEAQRSLAVSGAGAFDFVLTAFSPSAVPAGAPGASASVAVEGFGGVVEALPTLPDQAFLSDRLANEIAFGPGILCLQPSSLERLAFLEQVSSRIGDRCAVRCVGEGWPVAWGLDASYTGLAYAARSSAACVVFSDGEQPSDHALALLESQGVRIVPVRAKGPARGIAATHPSLREEDAAAAIAQAFSERFGGASAPVAPYGGPVLDDRLSEALARLHAFFSPRGLLAGSDEPRAVACVLGYFGKGNFGDELILSTVDERLRLRRPGSTAIAVSEDPLHTLRARGVYAVSVRDRAALDEALRRSSVALVVAGLLFDQGIRWTMGKAETISAMQCPDLPSIASYVELAYLNGAQPLFYGIGAGPLDVPDGRALVRLMGALGARFVARDEESARLVSSCGVPEGQVVHKADTAFLASAHPTSFVDRWLREQIGTGNPPRIVAVSLREYENVPVDFHRRIAGALSRVSQAHPDVRFALCVLDPSDRPLAERVRSSMHDPTVASLFDAGEDTAPVVDLLSRCCAGVSMRYHCSLMLASFGKPCVGLGYLPKVASLFADLGNEDLLLPMDASLSDVRLKLERALSAQCAPADVLAARVGALRRRAEEAEELVLADFDRISSDKSHALGRALFLRDVTEADLQRDRAVAAARGEDRRRDRELREAREEARRLRTELAQLRASTAWRAGRALTAPARAIKDALGRGAGR